MNFTDGLVVGGVLLIGGIWLWRKWKTAKYEKEIERIGSPGEGEV